jgi:hypothetical protein
MAALNPLTAQIEGMINKYLGNFCVVRILLLKWKNYDGDRILVETKKTQNTLSIKLPMKAKEIIEL